MKKSKQIAPAPLKGWTPFYRTHPVETVISDEELKEAARHAGVSVEHMKQVLEDIHENEDLCINSRYQVSVRPIISEEEGWPDMICLSIKRIDKQRVGPERYRDFLRIKNELVGPEHEAFELYPAMSRNVDTANQYYVWVIADPAIRVPVGFRETRMVDNTGNILNAYNEPFEEGDKYGRDTNTTQRKANHGKEE